MSTLLATGYDHLGVPVDLYGTSDDDGIEVEDVRLAGHSLVEWLKPEQLRRIERALEYKAHLDAQKDRAERQMDLACAALVGW